LQVARYRYIIGAMMRLFLWGKLKQKNKQVLILTPPFRVGGEKFANGMDFSPDRSLKAKSIKGRSRQLA
jgi:hypothetical protein